MVLDSAKMLTDKKLQEDQGTASEIELDEDYHQNIANGKKNLLCGDFPEAVACFQAACSLRSEKYGETSPECAEVFFLYGRALLELARVENGVLGNALKGVPETEDSSDSESEAHQFEKTRSMPAIEREQLRQDVQNAMATENEDDNDDDNENDETEKKNDSVDVEQAKGVAKVVREMACQFIRAGSVSHSTSAQKRLFDEEKAESSKEVTKVKETHETEPSDKPGPSSGEAKDEKSSEDVDDPDDIPNMQLAWEMLELSKVLYQKKPRSDESNLDVSKCHLKLGELSLEIENYSQAIGDFLECLVIHKELLPEHDRRLAETHYSLGLAYSFDKQFDNALEHYKAALHVLETRIDFLNEKINENDRKGEKAEETMKECAEIGEINELIPDINSKIEDVMHMKKEEGKFSGSPFQQQASSSGGETTVGFGTSSFTTEKVCTVIPIRKTSETGTSSGQSTASDITHLVRRKRATPDDETLVSNESSPTKKPKRDDGDSSAVNGSATHCDDENVTNGSKNQELTAESKIDESAKTVVDAKN